MRPLALVAALAACCCGAAAPAAAAPAQPRALIAFLPVASSPRLPPLEALAARGLSVGLASPTLGGYTRRQMMLDLGQGTRISTRAYGERVPRFELELRGPAGAIRRWDEVAERAAGAPGDARPGLLATTLARAGRRVAYLGAPAPEQVEAAVAADAGGRVARAELPAERGFGGRLVRTWRASDLLVTRLPFGREGLRALDAALAARRPQDLVVVMRAPPGLPLKLIPVGIAGEGYGGGWLRSPTTRSDGLVAATDVAPTVLAALGVAVPEPMEGRRIERVAGGTTQELRELSRRLDVVVRRRGPVVRAALAALALVLAGLALARGRAGARAGARLSLLSAMWMPGLALAAAALRPSLPAEAALLVAGSLALAALTDRLVPWPRGPALPAAVVLAAFCADLAAPSMLVETSIAGPNPKGGARFYGVGNELEMTLAALALLGTGAALARRDGARAARAFAVACLAAGAILGAGRLGAAVGAVITLGAGGAAAVLALLAAGGRSSRRALALAAAAPVVAVLALAAVDLATGGGAHLTRSVLEAEDAGDLLDVAERRWRISVAGLDGAMAALCALAVVLLAAGLARRARLLAPAASAPGLRAGIWGLLAATIAGVVANDSGPVMLLIGTAALALAVAYVHGAPARAPASGTSPRGAADAAPAAAGAARAR